MICINIPGQAVAFARAGAHGKRRFTPPKQADYMAVVRRYVDDAMRAARASVIDGPVRMTVHAHYTPPASWSARKRATAFHKTSKPDVDNIAKLVKDACNGVAYRDDAQITELVARKTYGPEDRLFISIEATRMSDVLASKSLEAAFIDVSGVLNS